MSKLSNTKVVHKVSFPAPARKSQPFSSKVAREARFRSSSSQPLPEHERTRWPHVRKLAGRSVDFRETFADLTPNICDLVGGCFCSGVFLRRPSGCAFPGQLWSAGILPALPVNTRGSSLLFASHPYTRLSRIKKTFATPFAELSRRPTPRPKGFPLHSSIQGPFGRLSYIYIYIYEERTKHITWP